MAAPVPSTNAISGTIQKTIWSVTTSTVRVPIAVARSAWVPIISRRRLQWSASSPAGSANNAIPSRRVNATSPALAGDPVNASTRRGYAIAVICDPPLESNCAPCRSTKSRFCAAAQRSYDDASRAVS
jgi:hypothetical protein